MGERCSESVNARGVSLDGHRRSLVQAPHKRVTLTTVTAFEILRGADLLVDATYQGGSRKNAADDPLDPLLGVGNQGGIRFRGSPKKDEVRLVVLYTTFADSAWPDLLDAELGRLVYYGDNKRPGQALEATKRQGNRILRSAFDRLHADLADREKIPPFFIFSKAGRGRDVIFRGLATPADPASLHRKTWLRSGVRPKEAAFRTTVRYSRFSTCRLSPETGWTR